MFSINNITWFLKFVKPQDISLQRSDGGYTVGVCDNQDKTIYINETLQGAFLWKVLCHEVAHAAMFSYGITLTLEQEELLADLIATYGQEIISVTNRLFKKLKERY
jgi:hypothetical protein